jgi:hypothetical protein
MTIRSSRRLLLIAAAISALGACNNQITTQEVIDELEREAFRSDGGPAFDPQGGTVFDLFTGQTDPNVTVSVNRYIWNASLDVLDFLPIESIDPFTGVIVFGYGTPPGGGTSYRATVFIRDPALDARSLNVSLVSRGGPASTETVRAVEDAILTRARQLRIADAQL